MEEVQKCYAPKMFRACDELKKDSREMPLKGISDGRGLGLGYKKRNHFTAIPLAYRWRKASIHLYVLCHTMRRHKNMVKNAPAIDDSVTMAV